MTYKNKYNDFYNKRNFSSLPQEKKKIKNVLTTTLLQINRECKPCTISQLILH